MTIYYVDGVSGNDANSGVDTTTPWKTATKITNSAFGAGDQILFKRGSTFLAQQLQVWDSGLSSARIVIGAYGTGANPIFDGNNTIVPVVIGGNFITLQDVTVKKAGDVSNERLGVGVFGTDVLIQRVNVSLCALGIQVFDGADRCRITASNISDNNVGLVGPGSNDDYGGQGITIKAADGCEIDHNTLDRNLTTQVVDYTEDGSAIEVFGATNLVVHHNTADGNQTFSELGLASTSGCIYHDNLITGSHDYQLGFNIKGSDEPDYGPLSGTTYIYNNTIHLTGAQTVTLAAHPGSPVSFHNNICRDTGTLTDTRSSTFGQKIDEGNNVWYGGTYTDVWSTANAGHGIASTSTIADPQFVSTTDRHLQATSPAIDRGSSNYGNTSDLDGNTRPSTAVDAGAYEYQGTTGGGGSPTSVAPGGISETGTVGAPTVGTGGGGTPVSSGYGAGNYSAGVYGPTVATATPTTLTNTGTVGAPTLTFTFAVTPTSISDSGTVGQPAVTPTWVAPDPILDPSTVGNPNTATGYTVIADTIDDTGTVGTPATTFTAAAITPTGVTNTGTVGSPAVNFSPAATNYSAGSYGAGSYGGLTNAVIPDTIGDPETVGDPSASGGGSSPGDPGTGYGSGPYGAGSYQGSIATPGGAATWEQPTFTDPLHLLGIGPWNPTQAWRGAPNYGIGAGRAPARPHLQLPGVQSKSFTLRLNDSSEASASLQFPGNAAVIVEEMATDLWWRRRDPRTGTLEIIGRFNTANNDLGRGTDGAVSSSLQFVDYRTLLGNRLVLKYLNAVVAESMWAKATPVTQIMRFAVPTNMGIDLTAIDDDTLLGNTTAPFSLPPSNSIADTFTALLAISEKAWEWWVDTPDDVTAAPKLMFAVGQRGANKGVTLVDLGAGPTPIASWTMRASSDAYANTIYFQGGQGGVVSTMPSQVALYGERDTQDSSSSVLATKDANGQPAALIYAARKRLETLADRRPTFTIVLRNGFWRGRSHIDIGDTVAVRIKLGGELMAYSYRVTELQVDIDSVGVETVTLTLGKPLASRDPRSRNAPLTKVIRKLRDYVDPTTTVATFDN